MLDYPILLKLLEYYQHYSPWLILALFLDAIFLLYINKKLHKADLSRNNSAHQEILKTRPIGLMLFILAAVCLLSINLGLDEFDSMEGANAMVAQGLTSEHSLWFISFMLMFAHQPFYPLMLNLCIRFSGLENFGVPLRAVSVFWGVLTVYLTYKFSIKIFNNKFISFFSASLLCLHSLFYFYSRRIESYSFLCFFSLLSCYYFWDVFIGGQTNKFWKYVLISIFCFFVHYLTLFVILSQFVAMSLLKMYKYALPIKAGVKFVKAISILCFAIILVSPAIYLSILNNEFLFKNIWQNSFYLNQGYFLAIIYNATRLVLGIPPDNFLLCLYLVIFVIIISKIRKYNPPFFALIIGVFLAGIFYEGIFLCTSWRAIGKLYPNLRHLVWMIPFAAMVYGYGAYMLFKQTKFRKIAGWLILSLPLLWNAYQSYDLCFKPQTPAYSKVANFIRSKCRKDDFIGRPVSWIEPFIFGEQKYPYDVKRGEINTDNFLFIKSKYKRVWALIAHEDYFGLPHYNPESINKWLNLLRDNLSLAGTWHAYKLDVYLFMTAHD